MATVVHKSLTNNIKIQKNPIQKNTSFMLTSVTNSNVFDAMESFDRVLLNAIS